MVESLEARALFSGTAIGTAAPIAAADVPATVQALNAAPKNLTNILPLTITGVTAQNGQLLAQGTLGGTAFTTPVTLTTSPSADPTCPILNLQLAPIHLNVLGLKVDTSAICLAVSAQSGSGNLLGNLLCGVANLLNQGTPLGNILGGLSTAQLGQLLGGITSLLNGALGSITAPSAVSGVSGTTPGACDILNLSLGPVSLNLLGLNVNLDNCAAGPVTVDITAVSGAGNLLGNLLCTVSHLLDNPSSATALQSLLNRVSSNILSLI